MKMKILLPVALGVGGAVLFAVIVLPALALMLFFSAVQADASTGAGDSGVVVGRCENGVCPGVDGPQAGLSVKAALDLALSEVGTSRPTGWDAPGECIKSVQRWIQAGGGNFAPGGPISGYVNSPAMRVTDGSMRPGDVVQYSAGDYDQFSYGVHTFMIVAVHSDGTFDLVESNNPGGSGLVGTREHTTAPAPAGFDFVVWRFAAKPDL